jgi:tRNA dimethylallyltransferase
MAGRLFLFLLLIDCMFLRLVHPFLTKSTAVVTPASSSLGFACRPVSFHHRAAIITTTKMASSSASSVSSEQQQQSQLSSSSVPSRPLVVVLAGPTASGKSDVAALLCRCRGDGSRSGNDNDTSDDRNAGIHQGGIIVSADSVQAYRGVQIGANKPEIDEQKETPHILIDVADCEESYNAADWMNDAMLTIEALVDPSSTTGATRKDGNSSSVGKRQAGVLQSIRDARNQKGYSSYQSLLPVVCGGTMMYMTWLVHGRPDAMRPSPTAVQKAKETIEAFQNGNFHSLQSCDDDGGNDGVDKKTTIQSNFDAAVNYVASFGSVFADRTQKFCGEDWYRLRRTLEIAFTCQEQQQENKNDNQQKEFRDGNDTSNEILDKLFTGEREGGLSSLGYDVRCFFLCPDDRMQHARIIDERCEQMILKGLLKETADLYLSGQLPEMAERAIGYRQTLDYLLADDSNDESNQNDDDEKTDSSSEATLFDAYLNEFTTATRRYAKKQISWFRKDQDFIFVPVSLQLDKPTRIENATKIIERLCQLSRNEYVESELSPSSSSPGSEETESMQLKKKIESQAKGMKFYQFERHILKPDSDEYHAVLAEGIAQRQRIRRKKKRKIK